MTGPQYLLLGAAIFAALFALVAWGIWRSGEWESDDEDNS